jgi:hypothetical protein
LRQPRINAPRAAEKQKRHKCGQSGNQTDHEQDTKRDLGRGLHRSCDRGVVCCQAHPAFQAAGEWLALMCKENIRLHQLLVVRPTGGYRRVIALHLSLSASWGNASDVNPLDTKIRTGAAEHAKQPLPAVPGFGMAGTIGEVGAGVTGFKAGDEVLGMVGCKRWRQTPLYSKKQCESLLRCCINRQRFLNCKRVTGMRRSVGSVKEMGSFVGVLKVNELSCFRANTHLYVRSKRQAFWQSA